MIGLGLLLQRKVGSPEQLKGVKLLILSLALPATIFVALLNIELSEHMLLFPLLALVINGLLLAATHFGHRLFPSLSRARQRTLMMLLPSLAPGLSCFPFLAEYLGDEAVALAALADVGNKLFVLLLLYLLAMHWYYKFGAQQRHQENSKIRQLVVDLFSEPINMVMIVALLMLGLGLNLQALPSSVASVILRLSGIMAPLILLFIGLAVKINGHDFGLILRLLSWRAGIVFVLSGCFIALMPELSVPVMLLAIVFPQSACSFWPYAHMSTVNGMEAHQPRTFDVSFALSVLAISLPFSTLIILGVLSFQSFMLEPLHLLGIGAVLFAGAFVPQLLSRIKTAISSEAAQKQEKKDVEVRKVLAEAG